jgi:hypothetical protein
MGAASRQARRFRSGRHSAQVSARRARGVSRRRTGGSGAGKVQPVTPAKTK